MASGQKNIASAVEKAIAEPIKNAGYDIWDVEYVKEGSEWYLRITIDRPAGVDIDGCEKVFRIVDSIVTELDPIEGAYHLEVSSAGIERDLRTPAHFKASLGKKVRLKLFMAIDGKKEFIGTLTSVEENGAITLCCPCEYRIEKNKISKANIYFDFDAEDYD